MRIACPLLIVVSACASGNGALATALERGGVDEAMGVYEQADPPPRTQLALVAASVLHDEALGEAQSRAAMQQLALAGVHARPVLSQLRVAESPQLAAHAAYLLTRLSDSEAQAQLDRALASEDSVVAAWALRSQQAVPMPSLMEALASVHVELRLAGLERAEAAAPDPQLVMELTDVLRRDPHPGARAAAARALAPQGSAAGGALQAALEDRESQVQLAALRALAKADAPRAARLFGAWFLGQPSRLSLEAARTLVLRGAVPGSARDHLVAGLHVAKPKLRAQAAVAMASLPRGDRAPLRALLAQEKTELVRFQLAVALGAGDEVGAETLRELMARDTVIGAQSASLLAREGEAGALTRVRGLCVHAVAKLRRVACTSLAYDLGRVHEARRALQDGDASVRVASAGAILRAGPDPVVR